MHAERKPYDRSYMVEIILALLAEVRLFPGTPHTIFFTLDSLVPVGKDIRNGWDLKGLCVRQDLIQADPPR